MAIFGHREVFEHVKVSKCPYPEHPGNGTEMEPKPWLQNLPLDKCAVRHKD